MNESRAPIASNTSSYTVKELSKGLKNKERIVIAHWMNPPYVIPLVEVAYTDWTSSEIVKRTLEILASAGKKPIIVPDIPGLIVNRFNKAVYKEALSLLANYDIPPEIIDAVWKDHLAIVFMVTGVLGTMDYVGIDTIAMAASRMEEEVHDKKIMEFISRMVSEGRLGVKAGRGFYIYDKDPVELSLERARKLWGVMRCLKDMR